MKIKKTVSYGSSPAIDIESPMLVEIGEALPSHRVPRSTLLADVILGLVVVAPGPHALNCPIGETRPRLDLCDSALA